MRRRPQFDDPAVAHQPDGAELRRADHHVAESCSGQLGARCDVDAGTTSEVGEFGHHLAETTFAQREHHVAGHGLRQDDRIHRVVERRGERRGDGSLVEHHDDRCAVVVAERFTDGQHGVHGPRVADVFTVTVEHHHGSTVTQPHQLEIGEPSRVAGAEHQAVAERALDALAYLVTQTRRVLIGHDHDRTAPAGVGATQLIDHTREQARRPEHDDVIGLDHRAATPLHPIDLGLDTAGDDADERAEHQESEERDGQSDQPLSPAVVAGHRAGVERAQQALPEVLEPAGVLTPGERHAGAPQQERRCQYDGERDDAEPQQHRPGTTGEQTVEPVSEVLAPTRPVIRTATSAHAASTGCAPIHDRGAGIHTVST